MPKVQAALGVAVAVFAFDAAPETDTARALQILTVGGHLPRADVGSEERLEDAALRASRDGGVDLGKRGKRLRLIGVDDTPGKNRGLTGWYYATAALGEPGVAAFTPVGPRSKLGADDSAVVKAALDRLRADTRTVAGAVALAGAVFTGDDLLRLHKALHGGPEGSERTFRRRVQELRDAGVLKPVGEREVGALRLRVPRFRSPAGTGGRPPELLRYSGVGGDDEQLASLRARRSA